MDGARCSPWEVWGAGLSLLAGADQRLTLSQSGGRVGVGTGGDGSTELGIQGGGTAAGKVLVRVGGGAAVEILLGDPGPKAAVLELLPREGDVQLRTLLVPT